MKDNVVFINCITMAVVVGIWLADHVGLSVFWWNLLVVIFLGYSLWGIRTSFSKVRWIIVVLFVVIGAVRFVHDQAPASNMINRYTGQIVTIQGNVCEIPQSFAADRDQVRVRYIVSAERIGLADGQTFSGQGKVIVSTHQEREKKIGEIGDDITIKGELAELHGFNNPGLIDTVAVLKRAGIVARMSVSSEQIHVDPKVDKNWLYRVSLLKEKVNLMIKKALPPAESAMLFGMLFGGYSGIAADVIAAFSATGIVHILSVSGTHIALVAGVVYWLCNFLRIKGKFAACLVVVVVLSYGIFAGFTPPVIRSAVMGIVAVGAVALGRERDSYHALAITSMGMLMVQPTLIYDISFQLSFGSTAGLIYLFPKIKSGITFLPAWMAAPLALTLAAQLGVLPFIAWYFNVFSLSSFVANLVIVPIVEIVVVLGLAAVLAGFLLSSLGQLILALCGIMIKGVIYLTKLLAGIPGGTVYLPSFDIVAGLIYYVILGWLFGFTLHGRDIVLPGVRRWSSQLLCFAVILLAAGGWYLSLPKPATIHFIDVAQGDATLIVSPHGRAVLVDTGGSTGKTDFDIGERVVAPYLRHYGVRSLDYLILTHGHQDHAGGAAAISKHIPIKRIVVAREPYSAAVQQLQGTAGDAVFIPAYSGQQILLDGLIIQIVYAVDSKLAKASNEASNVIKISYGDKSFLITGDLESRGEAAILSDQMPVASTVLKVGHHGAKTSTSEEFLQEVSPAFAVISVGAGNPFGHPHPEILKRLSDRQISVFRTDLQGAIVFETNGKALNVKSFRP